MPVNISLDFMPAFYTKHLGVRFGEAYYADPEYREEVERAKARLLHALLGRYGVGSADPEPAAGIFLQPIDLILRTQGAAWRFPDDATVECWGTPWAELSVAEIGRLDPRAAACHPVVDALIAQYRQVQARHDARADLLGLRDGVMNVHAPYTVAHQLCGESLFLRLAEEPDEAQIVLAKAWEITRAVFDRLAEAAGARPTHLQLGDCSASLLSAATYRDVVLPVNQAIARDFPTVGYHSCGPSSHLLEAFVGLPRLGNIQLGPGTDLDAAARCFPGVHLQPLVDPVVMREGSPDDAAALTTDLLRACAPAPAVTLCAWSFDRDTPVENVAALYDTALTA